MAGTDREMMNKIYKDFNLTPEHIFSHKHYKIIVRAGIDKIQASANIEITYDLVHVSPDAKTIIIKAYACRKDVEGRVIGSIETFGESSPENNKNEYPVAMAEKRAMARAVLKLAGLYEEGFFSEDEAEDFKESVRKGRNAIGKDRIVVESL